MIMKMILSIVLHVPYVISDYGIMTNNLSYVGGVTKGRERYCTGSNTGVDYRTRLSTGVLRVFGILVA